MADDIDKLIRWARSQGFRVEVDQQGYRRFYVPDGSYLVRYPATPSNPRRRFAEVVIALRKAGLPWPPPSKKEERSQRRKGTQQ
jgi:hypothetical protein